MKHTKSMVYRETEESRELFMYSTNNGDLYRQMSSALIKSLRNKAKNGKYDAEKAVDAWYYVATEGSNRYFKDYGYKFSVTDRYTTAVDMEKYYREEIFFELNT